MECNTIPIGSWDTHALLNESYAIDGFTPRPFLVHESALLRDQRMLSAFKVLSDDHILQTRPLNITNTNCNSINSGQPFKRFMIYAIDNGLDGMVTGIQNQPSIQLSGKNRMQAKRALTMVLLNMNVDPWIFSHESEPVPLGYNPIMLFQEDQSKRLINIYLDMPSPRAHDDPYMDPHEFFAQHQQQQPKKSIHRLLERVLQQDAPKGMRTKLYNYQKNSLWKLLRRELCMEYILDPTIISLKDMSMPPRTYYIQLNNNEPPIISRLPSKRWDDIPGGIICEDMGTGKSCLCIALIMQTLPQFSKAPPTATQIYCELYPQGSSTSAILIKDGPASLGTSDILMPLNAPIPTLRELAAAAVKMNGIEYRRAGDYIRPHTMELLEEISVYYYDKASTELQMMSKPIKSLRANQLIDIQSLEVYLSSATLVIVPPDLADQWCNEINKHTEDFALKLLRIDPDNSKAIPEHTILTKYDMVLITQTRFAKEYEPGVYSNKYTKVKQQCCCSAVYRTCRCTNERNVSPLMQVRWKRIIVDEGHSMGIKLSDQVLFAEKLHADRRWICTGTPTFNLANLKAFTYHDQAITTVATTTALSDKGDLDRLLTIMRLFLHIQPYYGNKTLFTKALVRSLEEHHKLSTGSAPGDWSLESLSSVSRLRYLMDRIMIRNRPEDVSRDVRLPPLYERDVGLDLGYYQVLTFNCQVALIQANAVLTEREDQDYFFHPSNRKHLARVIENLKDACFWYPGDDKYREQLTEALLNVERALQKHEETIGGKYLEADVQLLKSIREHLKMALTDQSWCTLQRTLEVGYNCWNIPEAIQGSYAIIPAVSDADTSFKESRRTKLNIGWNGGSMSRQLQQTGTLESEQVCIMLGKQIRDLRLKVQEQEQEQLIPASHQPIIINLDAPQPRPGAITDGGKPNRDPSHENGTNGEETAEELKLVMTKERLSQSTILSSTSSKLNYVVSQILRHQNSEKCIVFCQSQTAMYYIYEYLTLAEVRCLMYHTHGMSQKERSNNIMTFNTNETISAIIMNTKDAAFGIDLSSASRVYFVSPVWQTATMRQAVKRAHRIGQIRPVYVETLMIKGSFEEAILNRRKEIDSQGEGHMDISLPPSSSTTSSATLSSLLTISARLYKNKAVAKNMKKKAGKSLLDDSKMINFISHIGFMPLHKTERSITLTSSEREEQKKQLCLTNEPSLAEYWRTMRPTYTTEEDHQAFVADDRHYRDQAYKKSLEIPMVFPTRPLEIAAQGQWRRTQDRHIVSVVGSLEGASQDWTEELSEGIRGRLRFRDVEDGDNEVPNDNIKAASVATKLAQVQQYQPYPKTDHDVVVDVDQAQVEPEFIDLSSSQSSTDDLIIDLDPDSDHVMSEPKSNVKFRLDLPNSARLVPADEQLHRQRSPSANISTSMSLSYEELYRESEEKRRIAEGAAEEAKRRVQLLEQQFEMLRRMAEGQQSPSIYLKQTSTSSEIPELPSSSSSILTLPYQKHHPTVGLKVETEMDAKVNIEDTIGYNLVAKHDLDDQKKELGLPKPEEPDHYILFEYDDDYVRKKKEEEEDKKDILINNVIKNELDFKFEVHNDSKDIIFSLVKKEEESESYSDLAYDNHNRSNSNNNIGSSGSHSSSRKGNISNYGNHEVDNKTIIRMIPEKMESDVIIIDDNSLFHSKVKARLKSEASGVSGLTNNYVSSSNINKGSNKGSSSKLWDVAGTDLKKEKEEGLTATTVYSEPRCINGTKREANEPLDLIHRGIVDMKYTNGSNVSHGKASDSSHPKKVRFV